MNSRTGLRRIDLRGRAAARLTRAALAGVLPRAATDVEAAVAQVRPAGWTAAAGLVLGGLAAALLVLWTGENIGLGTYNHLLASSPDGTFFNASLALGAKSALAFWPGLVSIVVLLAEYGGRRSPEGGGASVLSVD